MNRQRMKEIIKQLKDITNELESEVYSDLDAWSISSGSKLSYRATSDQDELCD